MTGSGGRDDRTAVGDRLLRVLLLAYPPSFRRRFGREMLQSLRRDRDRPVFRGVLGRGRYWIHVLADVARTAPAAWVRQDTIREENRHADRGGPGWLHEARYVVRGLGRAPGFTFVAVLTMGLGIGAATAVFTVVHGVLLAPLPFPEPERLVRVWEYERTNPGARMVAYGNYADLKAREEGALFSDLAIWAYSSHTLTGTGPAVNLRTRRVSPNFARVFEQTPILGRWVTPQETRLDERVVVLSHSLWRDRFGSDSGLVGQTITLENEPYTVVGVMPLGFVFPPTADAWVPLPPVTDPQGQRRWHRHAMVGRLAANVDLGDAAPRLRLFSEDLARRFPETNGDNYFEVEALHNTLVGGVRPALFILLAACGVLLLIACINIASLLLARTTARSRELAVRAALGASRRRLITSVALESLLLGGLGGAVGLLMAAGSTSLLPHIAAGTIPRLNEVHVGLPAFVFALATTLISALLASIGPALRGQQREEGPAAALRTGRAGPTRSAIRNRRLLVGAELAMAVVLVTTAGLLIKSFGRLTGVETGVRAERVLTMDVRAPRTPGAESLAVARRMDNMLRTFEQLPQVERAAVVLTEPVDASGWFNQLTMRDRPAPEGDRPVIGYNVVTPGYFDVLDVPLLDGRAFETSDLENPERVVIINRAAAERYWPGQSPVGRMILGNPDTDAGWSRIVGVVENIRQRLTDPPWPEVFVPIEQEPLSSVVVVARVTGDPASAGPALRQAAQRYDQNMPVSNVMPLADRIGITIGRPRFNAIFLGTFAAIALMLACVGVYGVLSYSVATRRKEFGLRMAVGAPRYRVLLAVLGDAGGLGAVAVIIGLIAAVGASRLLEGLLFQVGGVDAGVLASVAALVTGVAVIAGLVPAWRATGVEPAGVLREE